MTRQSDWKPVRSHRTDGRRSARLFFTRRCKELAFGGLFSSIFLLSQSPLHALVIDDIRVLSKLGEPLRAEVRVVAAAGERLTQGCFSSVSGTGDLPAIGNVRLTLSRQLDSHVLRVASNQPMREPMSEFVLQVKCAGSPTLVRSFLVMVDPPEMIANAPAPVAEPASLAAAREAGRPIQRAGRAPVVASIEPGSRYLVRHGDMLSTIAARVAGRPDWSVWPIAQQIYATNPGAFVMGDPNRIAQGSTIFIPRLDQVDFSITREAVIGTGAANKVPVPATITVEPAPQVAQPVTSLPETAGITPQPQVVFLPATTLPAMQLTVLLGNESRMKLQLRGNGTPVVDTRPEAPSPATDPQPEPTTRPEIPDSAATPRVALPAQTGGTGWLGWLGLGAGLLLAFLLGALATGYALRRRLEQQVAARLENTARLHKHQHVAAAATTVSVAPPAPEPRQDSVAIGVAEEPASSPIDIVDPVHTVEVSTVPELDLELPHDEPARIGDPETLEMPEVGESLDFELSPGVDTGRTGQQEVDFELLEKAYSEDYVSQFIEPHGDQQEPGGDQQEPGGDDQEAAGGDTAQYYHLENRDPADEAPLPIELGEDEMIGEGDDDDAKIVNFPKMR